MKKFHHHIIYVSLLLLALNSTTLLANQYDAGEIRQLVAFLQQQSGEAGKTNAQAIGLTGSITVSNAVDWMKQQNNIFFTTRAVNNINYIQTISLENSRYRVRFGGSFQIKDFKYLTRLSLSAMDAEIKVRDCPFLNDFRLMSNNVEENFTERRLEIINCPALSRFRIGCLVTQFVMEGCHALTQVNINHTNFPKIDFSTQTQLQWLELANNAFSEILVPEAGKWRLNCSDNRIEPADLVALIRKILGDNRNLDWSFLPAAYKPQRIIFRDPTTDADTIFVGTKIDLTKKASFQYGNPEKTYTGTFKWQYEKIESWGGKSLTDLPQNPEMTKGVYTIPANMRGQTIVCTYTCESFITEESIQYIIHVAQSSSSSRLTRPEQNQPQPQPQQKYRLEAVSNNATLGTVTGSGNYEPEEKVQLVAKPNQNAIFDSWIHNEINIGNKVELDFIMPPRDEKITGNFRVKSKPPEPIIPADPPKLSIYLMLTSNLESAKLSGGGWYFVGNKAHVATEAPSQYKFAGWFLGDSLVSREEKFDFQILFNCNICLHAKYANPSKPQKPHVFEGKYSVSYTFYDDRIPFNPGAKIDNMMATGYIEYRPGTKDLWSPYSDNNLGVISFDLGKYEKVNAVLFGTLKQQAGYMAMTIYNVTDNVIIAGGGGYLFGADMFIMDRIFTVSHRIRYTLNSDGSITLKNFNITGKAKPPYPDVTFHPAPDAEIEREILWFEREGLSYSGKKYETERKEIWDYIKLEIMPIVEENMKNEGIIIKK